MQTQNIFLYKNDLPDHFSLDNIESIAIDTETMGLALRRDRLCLVQLSLGDGKAHLVQVHPQTPHTHAPNLVKLLSNKNILKLFHFARFDMAILNYTFQLSCENIFCTKIASRLARTYTDKHGLKDLCKELLNIELSKQQQSSDWGNQELSEAQQNYAAHDVLHLHALKHKLHDILLRENRLQLAQACFQFLPARVRLDVEGWEEQDIFAHS